MGYLLTEIVVYLVIAGLIGFAFGWIVRDGVLDKYFTKAKEEVPEVKEEVSSEKVAEVLKEEVKETLETKETVKEVAVETVVEVVEEEVKTEEPKTEVVEETVVEIIKEVEPNISTPEETVEVTAEVAQPTLLTEAPTEGQDKLSAIKGIGPVLEKKLNELGIYSFEQIASWDAEQEVWIGTQMAFPKRVTKEEWVKQAKELLKNK